MKRKLLSILLMGIIVIGLTGCGNIKKDNNSINSNNIIPKDASIIKIKERFNYSEGVAWIKSEDGVYYLIDEKGTAIFGLKDQKDARILEVDSYLNGYGKVHYRNDELNSDYIKLYDKKGNMVYSEWDDSRASHMIIAGPDDLGYILVNNLGKVESINLKTDYSYIDKSKWNSESRELESLGSGIFYNKYVGFYNASSGSSMPLDYIYIYDYNALTNTILVKDYLYSWSRFIDGKAIFTKGTTHYLVTNKGEVKEIEKLKGYKLNVSNSVARNAENSFNGKYVYAENSLSKEKGYYDLEGNKVIDLSKYDILNSYLITNDKVMITLKTEELNKNLFTIIDINGKELFKPISWDGSYYYLDDNFIVGNNNIIDYSGKILKDIKEYENADSFYYGKNGIITIIPKEKDGERKYLDSSLNEIKPYYLNNIEIK